MGPMGSHEPHIVPMALIILSSRMLHGPPLITCTGIDIIDIIMIIISIIIIIIIINMLVIHISNINFILGCIIISVNNMYVLIIMALPL